MKKAAIILSIIILATACKKEEPTPEPSLEDNSDKVAPLLLLNGKVKDTVILQTQYTDPGATATDDRDGNLTPFIMVSGDVNSYQAGDYVRHYNVRDAAGNTTKVVRYVAVRNTVHFMLGVYMVTCTSTTMNASQNTKVTSTKSYTSSINVLDKRNKQMEIGNLNIGGGIIARDVQCFADEDTIIGGTVSSGYYSIALNGSVPVSKTSFTLTSSHFFLGIMSNVTYSSTNVFIKQ